MLSSISNWVLYFLKPFLKGTILQSENERGVNLILTTILRF